MSRVQDGRLYLSNYYDKNYVDITWSFHDITTKYYVVIKILGGTYKHP